MSDSVGSDVPLAAAAKKKKKILIDDDEFSSDEEEESKSSSEETCEEDSSDDNGDPKDASSGDNSNDNKVPLSQQRSLTKEEVSANEKFFRNAEERECGLPKDFIPKWAEKDELIPAVDRQFGIDDQHTEWIDPDDIFKFEELTVNLELIFDEKKVRYRKRTESADWTKDGVTSRDKRAYKRTMRSFFGRPNEINPLDLA